MKPDNYNTITRPSDTFGWRSTEEFPLGDEIAGTDSEFHLYPGFDDPKLMAVDTNEGVEIFVAFIQDGTGALIENATGDSLGWEWFDVIAWSHVEELPNSTDHG